MISGSGDYAYVEHLLAEHRRLEQLIHRTLATLPAWDAPSGGEWLPAIMDGLQAIRREAAEHFREEEMGGCLEEAVAHCPRLSSELTRAEREQRELLADLDELIARAGQLHAPSIRDAHILGQELRAVIHKLRSHEATENHIIEHGFAVSLDTA
jgi:hypothetical protein